MPKVMQNWLRLTNAYYHRRSLIKQNLLNLHASAADIIINQTNIFVSIILIFIGKLWLQFQTSFSSLLLNLRCHIVDISEIQIKNEAEPDNTVTNFLDDKKDALKSTETLITSHF